MEHSERDWQYLPELCLFIVLEKLNLPSNLVQFGAVSKHWHSVFNTFLGIRRQSSRNLIPMLLIPTKKSETKRKLYSLQAQAIVCSIELPRPCSIKFCGSCYGWLATADANTVITLTNPFKDGISIDLPPLDYFGDDHLDYRYNIRKVVLSNDPSLNPDNYVVVVIYGVFCHVAVYISWQRNWIYLDKDLSFVSDIIFHRSLVYVIGHYNDVLSYDVNVNVDENSESPLKILVAKDRRPAAYSDQAYLVESSQGNLYSIHRELEFENRNEIAYFTKNFKVFKLVLDEENGELLEKKEVKSIDGDVVFVGDNGTFAVSALDFPEGQPNSIYFTDDYVDVDEPFGPRDIGIFNLKDGDVGQYFRFKPSHKDLPPYIWTLPPVEFRVNLALAARERRGEASETKKY